MTTLEQVARAAGFSMKTVSRVINEDPHVASATRETVLRVIQEMDYRPNITARRLASGKTHTIGVALHLSAAEVFDYPFFSQILRGISETLARHRQDMLLHFAPGETPYADFYAERRVDGLILMSIPMSDPHLPGLLESGAPCVFTCRIALDRNPSHWVDSDFRDGIRQCVDHLVGLGHRDIALIAGPRELALAALRSEGYREALEKHGIAPREELILYGDLFTRAKESPTRHFLRLAAPPTAIIYSDDFQAVAALRELHELGYRVPGDLSVVGFDDSSLAPYAAPPLTSVRQPGIRKGALAAETLLRLINDPDTFAAPLQQQLPVELVIRGSTAPPRQTSSA